MSWPKGKPFSPEHIAKRGASLRASGAKRKKPVVLDGVEYWKCGTCKVYKPAAEYYIDGKTSAGIASVCKSCHVRGTIDTRDAENSREGNAAYMRRARAKDPEKFKARERVASQKKRINSPEKVAARNQLNNAVKRGEVVKPSICETCGEEKRLTGHHDDYSKALMVRWLCYKCHGIEHRVIEFKRVTK